jgi:hypothetical protein
LGGVILKTIKIAGLSLLGLWVILASIVLIIRIVILDEELTQADYGELLDTSSALTSEPYLAYINKPFWQRINPALPEFLELQSLYNQVEGFPGTVVSERPDTAIVNQFKQLYNAWPESIKEFAENNIYFVHVVKNLGYSGQCWKLRDAEKYIITLDVSVFMLPPNAWLTAKITHPFKIPREIEVKAILEKEEFNTADRTLEFILLHEIGHAFGEKKGFVPQWYNRTYSAEASSAYPFLQKKFSNAATTMHQAPMHKHYFGQLKFFNVRNDEKQQGMQEVYRRAHYYGYPTIYSTQNEDEFFAESFVSYVHCVHQNRPYEISINSQTFINPYKDVLKMNEHAMPAQYTRIDKNKFLLHSAIFPEPKHKETWDLSNIELNDSQAEALRAFLDELLQ